MIDMLKSWFTEVLQYSINGAIWVENNFGNRSGKEKKAILVNMIVNIIDKIPFTPRPIVYWVVSWIADKAVSRLNIATSHNFNGIELSLDMVNTLAHASTAREIETILPFDDRYKQLLKEYNIPEPQSEKEEPQKEQAIVPIVPNELNLPVVNHVVNPKSEFDRCMEFVGLAEGGANFKVINGKLVLNSYDTGGATNHGITERTLKSAYASGIVNHCDITRLTKAEAKSIYKVNYWDAYQWDKLLFPLCLILFDTVVNGGLGYVCQDALNELGESLKTDRLYGKNTKEALFRVGFKNHMELSRELLRSRKEWYDIVIANNPKQMVNRKGWYARLDRLAKASGVKA